jgi:hypothetical protein
MVEPRCKSIGYPHHYFFVVLSSGEEESVWDGDAFPRISIVKKGNIIFKEE